MTHETDPQGKAGAVVASILIITTLVAMISERVVVLFKATVSFLQVTLRRIINYE